MSQIDTNVIKKTFCVPSMYYPSPQILTLLPLIVGQHMQMCVESCKAYCWMSHEISGKDYTCECICMQFIFQACTIFPHFTFHSQNSFDICYKFNVSNILSIIHQMQALYRSSVIFLFPTSFLAGNYKKWANYYRYSSTKALPRLLFNEIVKFMMWSFERTFIHSFIGKSQKL